MQCNEIEEELARGSSISIIRLVDELILCAKRSRASDIHINPTVDGMRIRFRIDGVLQNAFHFPKSVQSEVISRIKVLSGLPTDEHQSAQDGRFRYSFPDSDEFVDVRVSIAPTYHGENSVLRLLADQSENFTLESLGFSEGDRDKILTAIKKPSGMILSTGPTGSGKTTTLYTLIKMLNTKEVSIITIEDPIEYAVADVEQIQVNARSGLTFANGLRSILRQDPDIIMVGEIRDAETASIAINTALTGHLLLSTLHTNDAATTLPRLLDMRIEPYLVASTVNLAIGQRLVRKICSHCKEKFKIKAGDQEKFEHVTLPDSVFKNETYYRGKGCDECNSTGYSGRISINEVMVADDEIRGAILKKASASELRNIAVSRGMVTMLEDGIKKAQAGITTLEEVLRVVYD